MHMVKSSEGWSYKDEAADNDIAGSSSGINQYRAQNEFERIILSKLNEIERKLDEHINRSQQNEENESSKEASSSESSLQERENEGSEQKRTEDSESDIILKDFVNQKRKKN